RGLSTIRQGKLAKIGFAQSQAVVRASDHVALTRFFRAIGVNEGYVETPDRILRDLRIWGARRASLSPRLRAALEYGDNSVEDELLGSLLCTLARAWDGLVAAETVGGRRKLALVPALEGSWLDGWEARWHAPV